MKIFFYFLFFYFDGLDNINIENLKLNLLLERSQMDFASALGFI